MVQRSYSWSQLAAPNSLSRSSSSSSYVIAAPVSLARSSTTVFNHTPRGYLPKDHYVSLPNSLKKPAGVVGRTPYFIDRYPYVQYSPYSAGAYAANGDLADLTDSKFYPRKIYSYDSRPISSIVRLQPQTRFCHRIYRSDFDKPEFAKYSTKMGVDDAVSMYSKKYLTAEQLSKYWLTSSRPTNVRFREVKATGALVTRPPPVYRRSPLIDTY
uniref:Uncharacterized protein n=1 Tax=Romanomermis culicivorax TaxID=13658 RepID=A0A915IH65_ROMCU